MAAALWLGVRRFSTDSKARPTDKGRGFMTAEYVHPWAGLAIRGKVESPRAGK